MAFSAEDIVPDSPTNNFCTLNVLDRGVGTTNTASSILTDGNLKVTSGDNRYQNIRSTISFKKGSGIFYAEFLLTQRTTYNPQIGIATTDFAISSNEVGSTPFGWMMAVGSTVNGSTYHNSVQSSSYATFATNDILQVIVDSDNQQLFFGRNGTILNSGNAIHTNLPADNHITFCILTNNDGSTSSAVANFGQDPTFGGATNLPTGAGTFTPDNGIGSFAFQPPAGALALCTANLPDFTPTVIDDTPQDYFKAVTYTGTGYNRNITLGFQPDLVWVKSRGIAYGSGIYDSVRGAGANKELVSNLTYAEGQENFEQFDWVDSFDDGTQTGFSIDSQSSSSTGYSDGYLNVYNRTYVAWCWKAGGAPDLTTPKPFAKNGVQYASLSAANITAGTITPTAMSVNTDAGFSIVKFDGNSSGTTVGHGLNQAPEMVITKGTNFEDNWHTQVYPLISATETLGLNINSGSLTSNAFNNTAPTPSVFSISTGYATTGRTIVAYCWHSVEGYSKFGSYTGNGSPDGPFVYCGFRPAFLLRKNITTGGTGYDWVLIDNARSSYNLSNNKLYPNLSNSENVNSDNSDTGTNSSVDLLSNGFKVRADNARMNGSNQTYIYMAFAEQSFNYANAR